MHQITIALVALCVAVVRVNSACHDCGTPKCGPNEVPVKGNPRRDLFCRPLYTPPFVLKELRKCVCKLNFVRNSWGECVDRKNCRRCKSRLQKDWHTCSSSCPVTGNKPISLFCRTMCTPGCDCPPGWVVDPRNWKNCIKAIKHPPVCPPNSRFEPCVSTCEPVCGFIPPRPCFTHCHRGACVCNKGFTAFVRGGAMICVRQEKCLGYLRTAHLSVLNRTAVAEQASTHGVANNVGGVGTASHGMVPPSPLGHVNSGNVTNLSGTGSHGNPGIDLSRVAINTGAISLASGARSRGMVVGNGPLLPPEAGSAAVGSDIAGSTPSTASRRTATVSMTAPAALPATTHGMIIADVNGVSALPPDSSRTNAIHASLGAAGSHPGNGFVHDTLGSGSQPAGASVLSTGIGHGAVAGHAGNTPPPAPAGPGGVGTGTRSILTPVYSGRESIMTGIEAASARTPSPADSLGVRADLGTTGAHGGAHMEYGAPNSRSPNADAGALSAGAVRGTVGGGVGNTLSYTSAPSGNVGLGTGNAHRAVSSVSVGVMSGLGGPTAHKPIASQSGDVRTVLGLPDTDGGVHIPPGTRLTGPGTSLASSSLLSATERMHTIRRSLAIAPASASRTPQSVSGETSALPAASGIRGSIGAESAGASAIGVNLEAPGTHRTHVEPGAVNIRSNAAGTTAFLASATGIGAIETATRSVPTLFTGDRAIGNSNSRAISHGASLGLGVVGAGREGSTSSDFPAERGGLRVGLGTAQIHPSASVGSHIISLGAGSASTTGTLPLTAPGLSRVGTSTVSAFTPSSVRGITGATEASGGISVLSARPISIDASVSTSGTSQPLSVGVGGVGLGYGAASSPSPGLARPGTVDRENRQPSFSSGAVGANVMTGAENVIIVAGDNSHLSGRFSNVVNPADASTTMSGAPVLSGTAQPHSVRGISGTEEARTSVSRESGGPGFLIDKGGEGLNFGGGNASTSSIITAGHGVPSGVPMYPESTHSGRVTGAARGNNIALSGLLPSITLGSHSGTGSSHIGGIGAGGLRSPSGSTGSRDAGAFGGSGITTNTHSPHESGASVSSLSRETSGITGTDTYAGDVSRSVTGGEVLPSATTSSVNGLGTYSLGATTEGGILNLRTTGGAHAMGAINNGIVRHGEGMISTDGVGQYVPNTAGYHGIGHGINPYLPGFMLNGGSDYANTYLIVKPTDTTVLGGTRSDPVGYRGFRESETLLPRNMGIGGIQPNIGGATVRVTTSA